MNGICNLVIIYWFHQLRGSLSRTAFSLPALQIPISESPSNLLLKRSQANKIIELLGFSRCIYNGYMDYIINGVYIMSIYYKILGVYIYIHIYI